MGREFTITFRRFALRRVRPRRTMPRGLVSFRLVVADVVLFLTAKPWKGIAVTGLARSRGRPLAGLMPEMRYEYPDMKKKAAAALPSEERNRAPIGTKYLTEFPAIIEHIAVTKYEDGDPRQPGWITVKTQGRGWIVQVKDPDSGMSFQALGETIDKALETAELLLGCDDAPWEEDKWLKGQSAKKGKK